MKHLILAMLLIGLLAGPLLALSPNEPSNRVLVLLADGFNRSEYWTPYVALKSAGYQIDVAAPKAGTVRVRTDGKPHEEDVQAELSLADVDLTNLDRYAGLLIPGGYSPGNLEKHDKALAISKAFMEADKPVFAICHGPRLLMRAGVMKQRVGTCLASVANELADSWAKREYGKYLDEPVVVDDNLVTSRYPGDLPAFCSTMLDKLADARRGPAPRTAAKLLVVGAGTTGHERWNLREVPPAVGMETKVVEGAKDLESFVGSEDFSLADYDMMLVYGKGSAGQLKESETFAKLCKHFSKSGTLLSTKGNRPEVKLLTDTQNVIDVPDELKEAIIATAQTAMRVKPAKQGGAEAPKPDVVLVLARGFNDKIYAAVLGMLEAQGKSVAIAAEASALKPVDPAAAKGEAGPHSGWITGREGLPVKATLTTQQALQTGAMAWKITNAGLMAADGKKVPESLQKVAELAVADRPKPDGAYTAAIALRKGFEGRTAVAMIAWLRSQGRHVVVLGPDRGPMQGLNGMVVNVDATYDQAVDLAAGAVIVAPGGYFPAKAKARQAEQPEWIEEQAAADTKRLSWLADRHEKGATLVLFGLDSLLFGKQETQKDKRFAASSQHVWSFGRTGGRYTSEPATLSADRMISAKGFQTIGETIQLLQKQ